MAARRGKVAAIREQVEQRVAKEVASLAPPEEARFTSEKLWKAVNSGEDGDAKLFQELHRGQLCFDHAEKRWYVFEGHAWRADRLDEALARVEAVIGAYGREACQQAWLRQKAARDGNKAGENTAAVREEACLRRMGELRRLNRKRNILVLAASGLESLGITGDEWDASPLLLGCANGVFDLKTAELRPGRPDDFIRTVIPTAWLGFEELCATWLRFLDDIFNNNKELIAFTQRLFGCALSGSATAHVLPICWGQGRNGKSTLFETLAHVLGPLAGPVKAELLLDQGQSRSSAAPDPDLMALRSRRVAWASETSAGRRLDLGRVKLLTGGDRIRARVPYAREEIEFPPRHVLFLLTNHKPQVDADDYAIWRRIHLIPFSMSFVNDPKAENERICDQNLPTKLQEEASGILAWLVEGYYKYDDHWLDPPDIVKSATCEYQKSEDLTSQFVDDVCVVHDSASVQASVLFQKYQEWANSKGFRSVNNNRFSANIRLKFQSTRTGRGIVYRGIGLADESA